MSSLTTPFDPRGSRTRREAKGAGVREHDVLAVVGATNCSLFRGARPQPHPRHSLQRTAWLDRDHSPPQSISFEPKIGAGSIEPEDRTNPSRMGGSTPKKSQRELFYGASDDREEIPQLKHVLGSR
eukprot:scaffold131_cov335-Pavlova_lutheri.AAC.14